MRTNILKYDIVRDVAAGGAEVSSGPEVTAPISFAQFGKLHLDPTDERPLTRRTKSLTAMWGGISTNMWICSRDNTPETICTPSSLQTWRIIVRMRSRKAPSKTL